MSKPIGFAWGMSSAPVRTLLRIEKELENAIEVVINDTTRRIQRCRKLIRIAKEWRKRALAAENPNRVICRNCQAEMIWDGDDDWDGNDDLDGTTSRYHCQTCGAGASFDSPPTVPEGIMNDHTPERGSA